MQLVQKKESIVVRLSVEKRCMLRQSLCSTAAGTERRGKTESNYSQCDCYLYDRTSVSRRTY